MRAVWPWSLGELRRGWRSLVLIALLAAVAGGAVMAALAGARRADTAVDRHLDRSRFPEVTAFATEPVPEVMSWLERDPRVARTRELRFMAATPTHLVPGLEGGIMLATSPSSLEDLWVVQGRLPSGADEVAVSERTATDEGLRVGDRLPFHFIDGPSLLACSNGDSGCNPAEVIGEKLITGVIRVPQELAPNPYDTGFFLAGPGFAADLGPLDVVASGRIIGATLRDRADAPQLTAELSVRMPEGDATDEVNALTPAFRAIAVNALGLRVGAGVAAAAALLALAQAITRHLGGRRDDGTTLTALGTTRGVRARAAAAPVMLAALVAGIGAVGFALAISAAFPFGLARRADPDPGFYADWPVLVLGGMVVLIAVAGIGLVAGWRWAAPGPRAGGPPPQPTLVSQLTARLSLAPVPTTGARFALESGRGASRVPAGQVVAAVIVAVAVMAGAFVVRTSLHGLLDTPARYGASWDLHINYPSTPAGTAVAEELARDDRVDAAAVASAGELTVAADGRGPIQVSAIGMRTLAGAIAPAVLDGRLPQGLDEVLVGTATMRALGLGLGDRISLEGADGERREARVVGRAIMPIVGTGDTDRGVVVPLETFDALGGDRLVADLDAETVLLLRIPDAADRETFASEVEDRYGALVEQPFRQGSVSVLEELDAVPLLLAGFTGLLGALVAAHALTVAGRRRRGDLAVLRALGFRPRQAGRVIWWQSFTLVGVALAIGLPLGVIGGRLVWRAIAASVNVLPVVDLPGGLLALTALAAITAALVLAILPGRRAARLAPAAVLRTE